MNFFSFFLLIILFFFLSACSINRQLVTLADSKKIGFISDGSYVLQDPPAGKSRVYVFRDKSLVGSYLGFTVRIEYEPKKDKKGRPDYQNYQDSLGYLAVGRTFFADIWAGHPVAITAHTESTTYLLFTPMEGEIYCIKGSMKNGFTMPRPNLEFVDKQTCEDAWIDYFKSDNIEFQNQWRKVYNERADRILIEPPFEKIEDEKQDLEQEDIVKENDKAKSNGIKKKQDSTKKKVRKK